MSPPGIQPQLTAGHLQPEVLNNHTSNTPLVPLLSPPPDMQTPPQFLSLPGTLSLSSR